MTFNLPNSPLKFFPTQNLHCSYNIIIIVAALPMYIKMDQVVDIVLLCLGQEDKSKLKIRSTGIFDKKQQQPGGSSSSKAWNVLKRLDSSVLR